MVDYYQLIQIKPMSKKYWLEKAIEITKERAGSSTPIAIPLDTVLENVYKKLKELAKDAEK